MALWLTSAHRHGRGQRIGAYRQIHGSKRARHHASERTATRARRICAGRCGLPRNEAPHVRASGKAAVTHFPPRGRARLEAVRRRAGVEKRPENANRKVDWITAMKPGKRRVLDTNTPEGLESEQFEQRKARIRAKVEHPFRVIRLQFRYAKVRYRGLAKNAARLTMLFAFANLWKVRKLAIPMG